MIRKRRGAARDCIPNRNGRFDEKNNFCWKNRLLALDVLTARL